ncbi:uncharacterized protein SPAPADRAFT_58414 [Spathaspora passalidarum NRRL Y-27907]|uniref:Inositolphosphotransferase Aur1/Ipt1 domain-containing protein n=1 Tax=Spathaspora passalidarum (strain NRRL Y-27907 / 11-Y1) TaxID=619300 RepID=G3AG77_SPAPN|nr:uncharacterized protein SPAPADRAFT_58414 [Spathaspora passalidarum NRRL Y-27907]EGW35216.1 hypothetical protein SPAPADRAFT_58414 [Spathaspora passalidarum NRRL Y-27907]
MDTSEMILTSPSLASDTPSIVSPPSESEILESGLFEFTEESASTIDIPKSKAHHHWRLAPVFLLAISWTVLNILYSTKNPVTKPKNIVAWVFHVVVHFVVPPLFGGWLYIFHPPRALKLFIVSSGLQTVAITLTYLVFPNAPPLFIKLYGENKEPTFDMIYTDGITSVDMRFGVMLHKLSYYAIPNKFSSFPSLHSANACLIFFFVCYYSKWTSFKLLGLVNVLGQWWSELYLDHHWRFDCFAGMLYAITTWVLLMNWKKGLQYVDDRYTNAKANLDMKHGSTMGMRLFRNTRLKNFFDPQV